LIQLFLAGSKLLIYHELDEYRSEVQWSPATLPALSHCTVVETFQHMIYIIQSTWRSVKINTN